MAIHRITLFEHMQGAGEKKPVTPVVLPAKVQNDVFLKALLDTPTAKLARRSPLEWAGAAALHVAIVAALLIIPLYTTGTIRLSEYNEVPLVAPPPPPPPPPARASAPAAPRATHARAQFTYATRKLTAPRSIPKTIAQDSGSAVTPDLGVTGGVPGGIPGGQLGGSDGVFGGTGAPKRPAQPQEIKQPTVVRAGSLLKQPRQIYRAEPEYPTLALQTRIGGVVVVDAIIDEKGNVVQAHAISGQPLLIPAALRAVLQWRYEPSSLNGRPVSVELQVQVQFNPKG